MILDGFIRQNLVRGTPMPVRDLISLVQEDLDELPRTNQIWHALLEQGCAVLTADDNGIIRPEPRVDIALRVRLHELAVMDIIACARKGGEPEVTLL